MKIMKLLPLLSLLLFVACSSSKPQKAENIPDDIYAKLMFEKQELVKKGIVAELATATSRDRETAMNKVELDARAKIGRAIESKTSSLQKSFKEEVGEEFTEHFTQVNKNVSSRLLQGTTLIKTPYEEKNGKYHVYGLMVLDPQILKDALAAEMQANEAMKSRFMASKAYNELAKEVEDFEDYKKSMSINQMN